MNKLAFALTVVAVCMAGRANSAEPVSATVATILAVASVVISAAQVDGSVGDVKLDRCDSTAWSLLGGLVETTYRNCAGAILTRNDTVMMVTSADHGKELREFGNELLPGFSTRHTYEFTSKQERCAAVYSKPGTRGYTLHIGTDKTLLAAEGRAKQSCNSTKSCRKVLAGCNGWESIRLFNPYRERIQFARVDGRHWSECGGRAGTKCKVR